MNILVCEDDVLTLKTLEYALKKDGYSIITAADGLRGAEILKENKDELDFMITDQHMPYVSGLELVYMARVELKMDIPIVMITRVGLEEAKIRAGDLGVDEYITKPFNPGDLSDVVGRLREKHISGKSSGTGDEGESYTGTDNRFS